MNRPLVSVIMSCYNYGEYVKQAVDSILNQTYKNIELVIVDNGSTDNSYEILKGFGNRIHKLMHLDKNDLNRSAGLLGRNVSGEYVAFMTADDYWHPEKIEKQMKVFESYPNVRACFTWAHTVDEYGKILSNNESPNTFEHKNRARNEWMEQIILRGNLFSYPSTIVHRESYYELPTNHYYQLGDKHLWMNFLMKHDIFVVEEQLTFMRWHPNSKTPNMSSITSESAVRTYTETVLTTEDIIEKMDDKCFVQVFGKYMRDVSAATHKQIACEKFFFLMQLAEKDIVYEQSVINFYYKCNSSIVGAMEFDFEKTLLECYGYSYIDFQEYCAKHGVGYRTMQMAEMEKQMSKEQNIIFYDILRDVVKEDIGIEERKRQYRKRVFLRLEKNIQTLMKGIYGCLEDILKLIEESDDDRLMACMPEMISSVCDFCGIFEQIWKMVLSYDFMNKEEWEEVMKLLQSNTIDVNVFCNRILPFIVELYDVLRQYIK